MEQKHIPARWLLGLLIIPCMLHAQGTYNNNNNTKNKEHNMTTVQRNKELVQHLYGNLLNKRNIGLLKDYISDDYVSVQGGKGAAGFQQQIMQLIQSFPDIQWHIEELVGDGNKVVVKFNVQGTHTGPFQHIPPTGKAFSNNGMAVYELKDGKVIGTSVLTDRLSLLQQLGVLPADIGTVSPKKVYPGQVSFIDKFFIPAAAKAAFYERMQINRHLIKTLPGFIEDAAYEYTDNDGNLICITVAQWESREALNKARETVQAAYKKEGFDAAEMFARLKIVADRGIYTGVKEQQPAPVK